MTRFARLATAALACLAGLTAHAAQPDTWPTQPINMIVPFPPGGVADAVGRPVAEAMGRALGQTVVVENRGGAGGGSDAAGLAPQGLPPLSGHAERGGGRACGQ